MSYASMEGKSYAQLSRPTVAFDLDGVLADNHAPLLKFLREHGHTPDWEIPPEWEVAHWGLDSPLVEAVHQDYYKSCQIAAELPPIAGAGELFRYFRDRGPTVVITSRHPCLKVVTIGWLTLHGMAPHELVMTGDKARAARERGVVLMFEDAPQQLRDLDAAGVRLFKPEYPYNTKAPGEVYTDPAEVLARFAAAEEDDSDAREIC